MKRTIPLSLPAVFTAALLPGLSLVGCKSTEMAEAATASETEAAVADSGIEIVRPSAPVAPDQKEASAATEMAQAIAKKSGATEEAAPITAAEPDAAVEAAPVKEPKKFRLFGKKDRAEETVEGPAEVAEKTDEAEKVEEVAEAKPKRERKPLFSKWKKNKDEDAAEPEAEAGDEAETEVAAVKEKKKFRLFGFGKKNDEEEAAEAEGDALVAANATEDETPEPNARASEPIEKVAPWDEPTPAVANNLPEDTFDPNDYPGLSDVGAGAASGVTAARIRPTDTSGGIDPIAPVRVTSPLDEVPSLTSDVPVSRPRDDGYLPLTPEPKFPSEEGILPPGE